MVFVGHDNRTDQIPNNIMIFLKLKIYTILIIRTFKKVNNYQTTFLICLTKNGDLLRCVHIAVTICSQVKPRFLLASPFRLGNKENSTE